MRGLIGAVVLWASVVGAQTLSLPNRPAQLWPGVNNFDRTQIMVATEPRFGASPDDTSDDTAAFARISAAMPSTGGGYVFIPCGTYRFKSTSPAAVAAWSINKPNITIQGANRDCVVLKFADDATTDIRLIGLNDASGGNASGLTIRDLTLDGNGSVWVSGGHNGITRSNVSTTSLDNVTIQNVKFQNFYNASITNTSVIQFTAHGWNGLRLKDLVFRGNRALGINLGCTAGTCGNFSVENIDVDNTNATAASPQQNVLASSTITVGSNSIKNVRCGTLGVCAGHCILNQADNTAIVGNTAVGCPYDQIVVSGQARNVTITGNTAENGLDGGFGLEAATGTNGPTGITFTGNTARGNYSVGLFVINTKYAVITGNSFEDNCTNPTPPTGCAGVYISGESGFTSVGNILAGNSYVDRQGVPTQKYGVQLITAFVDGTVIEGGTFFGNTTGDYRLDAATNTRISDYRGGTISTANSPTYSIAGGLATYAQMNATAPQNGSYLGCSDCNGTCSAGSSNGQHCERVSAAWTN